MTDLLVIGGGAAGLMAAGAACARGLTVTVLEHNPKGPGQKLLITGKGRCNVTSDSDVREFLPYVRHNGRFLYSSLYAFPPSAAMELFESLGVPLKTERGRRVFPRSDRAADVLAALRDYARDAEFVRGSAKKLVIEDGVCKLPDRSAFAGSVATSDRLVRVLVEEVGVSVPEAVGMITDVPARIMGLNKGKLAAGYDADIISFGDRTDVRHAWVIGKQIF